MSLLPTKIHSSLHLLLILSLLSAASCTTVRQYRSNQPFVYENKIVINDKLAVDVKSNLKDQLENQIEDSVKPKIRDVLFFWHFMRRPPVFDTVYVKESVQNMRNLLSSNGYFRGDIQADWSKVDTFAGRTGRRDQLRMTVTYNVNTGKVFRMDSIRYQLTDSNLQKLAAQSRNSSLLRPNEPFSYGIIDNELTRLTQYFRNNGYYKISRENVIARVDTVDVLLIDPSTDPFEQVQLQVEARRRFNNPTINVTILQSKVEDTTTTLPYRIGEVYIVPEIPADQTVVRDDFSRHTLNDYTILERFHLFKRRFLVDRMAIKPGNLYRQTDYSRTLAQFNRLEAWQSVNFLSRQRDSSQLVDLFLRMVPAKKYVYSADLEGYGILSNTSAGALAGSIGNAGAAISLQIRNRNVGKSAIRLDNTFRAGLEFTNFSRVISSELSLSNRLVFPWLLLPFRVNRSKSLINANTFISLDGSYLNRFNYYKLNSVNLSMGYEWQSNPGVSWQIRFPNIEITRLFDVQESFRQLIRENPLLAYSYTDGLIIGMSATYSRRFEGRNPRHTNFFRLYAEESGLVLGAIAPGLTDSAKALDQLYRYVKFGLDFRRYDLGRSKKSTMAYRLFLGYGIALETRSRRGEVTLPFFKAFFAGGSNSMRAWQLRKLGPGSSIYYDTLRFRSETIVGTDTIRNVRRFDDRFADIQLELNLEYRFDILPLYGYWLRGALFTDIGNVWSRRTAEPELKYGTLTFSRLYQDMAVAGGAGLRMDFKFFLLRFDFAWRLKDPLYSVDESMKEGNDGWFIKRNLRNPTFQFGIGYPF